MFLLLHQIYDNCSRLNDMRMFIYDTLDSTNDEAKRLLNSSEPPENGSIIMSNEQTAGRGQYGRIWQMQPDKHLAMSLVLQPPPGSINNLPWLNMAIALGIRNALLASEPDLNISIKWPNDLYIGSQKLGGILVENILSGNEINWMIIGIGINVNEEKFSSENPNAISLNQLTGKKYPLDELATSIRDAVMNEMANDKENIIQQYNDHLFGKNLDFNFLIGDHLRKANVQGVDEDGKLSIKEEDGEIRSFYSHQIKWWIR